MAMLHIMQIHILKMVACKPMGDFDDTMSIFIAVDGGAAGKCVSVNLCMWLSVCVCVLHQRGGSGRPAGGPGEELRRVRL